MPVPGGPGSLCRGIVEGNKAGSALLVGGRAGAAGLHELRNVSSCVRPAAIGSLPE